MKIFEKANVSGGWVCPICGKNDDKPVILAPIDESFRGQNEEAEQIHVDCINLRWRKNYQEDHSILYHLFEPKL